MFRKTFQHILIFTFFVFTTINAQIVDSALVGDSTKILNQTDLNEGDKPLVRYESGIKIVGEKMFDVDIKNGNLYIINAKFSNGEYRSYEIDFKERLIEMNIPNATIKDIKQIIYTKNDNETKLNANLVFENGIMKIIPSLTDKGVYSAYTRVGDESKIFTHDGAIYTSQSGSIVTTTPTTLLIITPTYVKSATYKEMFGVDAQLVNPTITAGDKPNFAVLRDETIKDDKGSVKLVINLNKFEIQGVPETKEF